MRSFIAAAALMSLGPQALAQAVGDRRFDPATGDYYVWVMDDSRRLLELRVVPPNKVLATVAVKLETGRLRRFRYAYAVKVLKGTRQPLVFVEIDCPASTVMEGFTAIAVHNGVRRRWMIGQVGEAGSNVLRHRCDIMERGVEPLQAGGALEVGLETILLPTIGEVRLFGSTGGVSWPTSDPISENEPAERSVAEVSGSKGGWKSIPALVPGRDPASVTNLDAGLAILQSDLDRACDLAWITSADVCRRLKNRLQQASPSATRGNDGRAQVQLQSFLRELAAEHNAAGTLPVNDAAFWLLKVNVEYILSRFRSTPS